MRNSYNELAVTNSFQIPCSRKTKDMKSETCSFVEDIQVDLRDLADGGSPRGSPGGDFAPRGSTGDY